MAGMSLFEPITMPTRGASTSMSANCSLTCVSTSAWPWVCGSIPGSVSVRAGGTASSGII